MWHFHYGNRAGQYLTNSRSMRDSAVFKFCPNLSSLATKNFFKGRQSKTLQMSHITANFTPPGSISFPNYCISGRSCSGLGVREHAINKSL